MRKFLLTIAPAIAGVAITISYLPQLFLTFTTKNVTGQSLPFWLLLDLALLGLFLQQIGVIIYNQEKGKRNYTGAIVQGINLICALAMTLMVVVFR